MTLYPIKLTLYHSIFLAPSFGRRVLSRTTLVFACIFNFLIDNSIVYADSSKEQEQSFTVTPYLNKDTSFQDSKDDSFEIKPSMEKSKSVEQKFSLESATKPVIIESNFALDIEKTKQLKGCPPGYRGCECYVFGNMLNLDWTPSLPLNEAELKYCDCARKVFYQETAKCTYMDKNSLSMETDKACFTEKLKTYTLKNGLCPNSSSISNIR